MSKVNVPGNIKYLSDWRGFKDLFENKGHIILNKKITGCGATSYFLNQPSLKVILCSPRKLLLEDKYKQCESYTHWFRNNDDTEEDKSQEEFVSNKKKSNTKTLSHYKDELVRYLVNCDTPKILVTYDSLKYVLETVKYCGMDLDEFYVVVDEFHSIFQDSNFKPDTEIDILSTLQTVKNVIYLSATPIMETYLNEIDELKSIPYTELVWPESRIMKTKINRVKVESLTKEAIKVVNNYLLRVFPTKLIDGNLVESTQAVLYFNAVKSIIDIIKKLKLTPEQVNILCADTVKNRNVLKRLGHTIGSIPKKGKPHKMFTFCTRTAFLGTDFYSPCASTYIFADPNIKSLSIDISLDLPQIVGRQRLESNPFRNDITLFYKTSLGGLEDFEKQQENKMNATKTCIEFYNQISNKEWYVRTVKTAKTVDGYTKDYIGFVNDTPKFNSLVYLSEKRAYEIQELNFKSDYLVMKSLEDAGYTTESLPEDEYCDLYTQFTSTRSFETKMEICCNMYSKYENLVFDCKFIPSKLLSYLIKLGVDKIKSLKYREKLILDYIEHSLVTKDLVEELKTRLKPGDRLPLTDIKSILGDAYKKLGLNITPKAVDLQRYFNVSRAKVDGKEGYEIISYEPEISIENEVSVFLRAYDIDNHENLSTDEILGLIKTGDGGLKETIEEIRSTQEHSEQGKLKYMNLPLVCWNGTFTQRNNDSLVQYSSYIALDFDGLSESTIKMMKSLLKNYEFVKACFRTPSGKGLKVIVLHNNTDPVYHKNLFEQLAEKFKDIDGFDVSVSDLGRGHYLSYDPEIWINPNPKSFKFIPDAETVGSVDKKKVNVVVRDENQLEDNKLLEILEKYWDKTFPDAYQEGNRHKSVLARASKLNAVGIPCDRAISYLISRFNLPDREVGRITRYVYEEDLDKFGKDRESFRL